MYMNNWDKGVAPAICLCIYSAGDYILSAGASPYLLVASSLQQERLHSKWGSKYAGENSWSHTYLQQVLYHVMDTLISGWGYPLQSLVGYKRQEMQMFESGEVHGQQDLLPQLEDSLGHYRDGDGQT